MPCVILLKDASSFWRWEHVQRADEWIRSRFPSRLTPHHAHTADDEECVVQNSEVMTSLAGLGIVGFISFIRATEKKKKDLPDQLLVISFCAEAYAGERMIVQKMTSLRSGEGSRYRHVIPIISLHTSYVDFAFVCGFGVQLTVKSR